MDEVTQLLKRISDGDQGATERLLPLVYGELHRLATRSMDGQQAGHTLQPTALVHEAYLKLVDLQGPSWEGRRHFLGVAAKAMRTVLIDHARARHTAKRGGGQRPLLLEEGTVAASESEQLLELNEALTRLAGVDPQLAELVELRFFGGLSVEEAAEVLEVSARTVKRGWRTARAWLRRELEREAGR